ncbi:MAG TPA: VOC family protein [Bacillota bacterium]
MGLWEEAYETVVKSGYEIIHPFEKQAWGQNVFRFYDPDRHIPEIGEATHLIDDDFCY